MRIGRIYVIVSVELPLMWHYGSTHFKLQHQWYRTPVKLVQMKALVEERCWRCGRLGGSFLHMWWDCVVLHPFWLILHHEIETILMTRISFHPEVFLLHDFWGLKRPRQDTLLVHMLMAASLLIAQHWNSKKIPSFYEWRQNMHYMFLMSKLTTMFNVRDGVVNAQLTFQKHWSVFQNYCSQWRWE